MSDIVERLNYRPSSLAANELLLDDCKAEIERLRQHLADANYEIETIRAATIEECAGGEMIERMTQAIAEAIEEGYNDPEVFAVRAIAAIRALKEQKWEGDGIPKRHTVSASDAADDDDL